MDLTTLQPGSPVYEVGVSLVLIAVGIVLADLFGRNRGRVFLALCALGIAGYGCFRLLATFGSVFA